MDKKELIECITREVLKKLDEEKAAGAGQEPKKEKLLLTENVKLDLSKELKAKYEICSFAEINSKSALIDINEIIITKLDMKLLIELSELIQLDPKAELILTSLLEGKNIYVLTAGVQYYQYQQSSPKTLYNKLIEAEDKLKKFGIQFLSSKELELNLKNKNKVENKQNVINSKPVTGHKDLAVENQNEYFKLDKKLIDYSIIKNLYEKKYTKIEVLANSIVTALAQDFIKDKNIKLKYIEGR